MKFENLFSIPNQELIIIEILLYIFVYSLYNKHFNIIEVNLIPSSLQKRIYIYDIQNEWIYTSLPSFWEINLITCTETINCPNIELHLLLNFINKCIEFSEPRIHLKEMKKLYNFFKLMSQELYFQCQYCIKYKKELKKINKETYLHLFYSSIQETSFDNFTEVTQFLNENAT